MIQIRNIQQQDNPVLAKIVKDTLAEFAANHPNTVYYDPTTDALYQLFQKDRSQYFVAELDGQVVGGGGIYPTDGLAEDTENGYKKIYLETMPELKQALKVYEKFGFEYLKGPMGNSGHTGCSLWMLKKL